VLIAAGREVLNGEDFFAYLERHGKQSRFNRGAGL
jgi:hypothetical protein